MTASPSTPGKSFLRFLQEHKRWSIVLVLYLFSTMSNLDRQTISVLAPTLKTNLHFGSVEYSYIVSGFLLAYAMGYAFCGSLIDRWGVKIALTIALVFWSLAGIAHALVAGWVGLVVCRVLLGLGESFNVPAGIKAITQWVPAKERGICIALFSNGHVTGAILAPPLVAFLALHFGWRWSFVFTGSLGLILALVWWNFYHSPATHPSLTTTERALIEAEARSPDAPPVAARLSYLQVLKSPLTIGFFVSQSLTDPISFFLSFWLPDYLQQSRGLSLALVGLVAWLPFLGADLGGPGGGAISDWLTRRGWHSSQARRALMLFAACIMLVANVAVRTDALWISLTLIGLMFAAQSCWKANLFTLIAESTPRENIATVIAVSSIGGSLGGVAANLAAGQIIAAYGYKPVFTAISVMPLIALAILEFSVRGAHRRAKT